MRLSIILILLLPFSLFSQDEQTDSLLRVLGNSQQDTAKVDLLITIYKQYYRTDFPTAKKYIVEAAHLADSLHYMYGLASSYSYLGVVTRNMGDYDEALSYFNKSLDTWDKMNREDSKAQVYNNIGNLYYYKADYETAIDYYLKSIELKEKYNDSIGATVVIINIGAIYYSLLNYDKAAEYFKDGAERSERARDTVKLGIIHANLGAIYWLQKKYDDAMVEWETSLKYARAANHKKTIAGCYSGMAKGYFRQKDTEKAIKYSMLAVKLMKDLGDKEGEADMLNKVAQIYVDDKQGAKALRYLNKSQDIAMAIGATKISTSNLRYFAQAYYQVGKYKLAYDYKVKFDYIQDSLLNADNKRMITEIESKYQSEKKELEIANLNKEKALQQSEIEKQQAEVKKQNIQKTAFAAGFGLMLILAFVVYRSYVQKRKDHEIISQQKLIVETQKEEIVDSINYAKRIQEAILPPAKIVKEWLQESFILYKPKDIVAGDFYWMERPTPMPSQKEGNRNSVQQVLPDGENLGGAIYFAAADCTGHGVPGAMVSVVCSNALSKALVEENITDPGKLLDRTRELVIDRFGRSEEEIKDGMDIALCALHGQTVQFAGANNPLWIIRKGAQEVEEIKGDKQPIGTYAAEQPFTTQIVQLNKGDSLYIFSDGFQDQFGGVKGKKYKSGKLKHFLISIQDKDMATQRQLLHEEFENWKGDIEQIDDVCVIGVRV